jgi:hypothetical protein
MNYLRIHLTPTDQEPMMPRAVKRLYRKLMVVSPKMSDITKGTRDKTARMRHY